MSGITIKERRFPGGALSAGALRAKLFLLLVLLPSFARAAEVVVLLDPDVRPYVEVLAAFQEKSRAAVKILERREDGSFSDEQALAAVIERRRPNHILAIGGEALAALADNITDIPILYTMVLNPGEKLANGTTNISGVSLNVPPRRTMQFLQRIAPGVKTIGTVYNPAESGRLIKEARTVLKTMKKDLIAEPVSSPTEALQKAKDVLARTDCFWMVPGKTVQNLDMVRYLLFTTHREKKPLIGISGKYVKAGALFAFNVDVRCLGYQTAALSNRLLQGIAIDRIHPEDARNTLLVINRTVAENLGIAVPEKIVKQAAHVY